jgi:hypothetical protein
MDRAEQILDAYLAALSVGFGDLRGDDLDLAVNKIFVDVAAVVADVTPSEIMAAAATYADRLASEVEVMRAWVIAQRKLCRPEAELTWGNCVRELGLLRPR